MTGSHWTCAKCGVTARFMAGALTPSELPPNWDEVNGIAYCLGCRRRMAGEAKAEALRAVDASADLVRAHAEGRVEFELNRAPDTCDTRIARICGTNVLVTRQVRESIGAYPTRSA